MIASLLGDPGSKVHSSLGFRDLEALPSVLRDSRSALVLVKTDMGNLARMLVAPAFRKRQRTAGILNTDAQKKIQADLVPLLLVERFEVFDGGHPASRIARGRDLMLFDGFQLDLDSGQVVPEGLGGDLRFTSRGSDDGTLSPLGPVQMTTLAKPPPMPASIPGQPPEGRAARHGDLSGRFRLVANGQWSGLLELVVDAAGAVAGRFQSDASGSDYAVSGKVDPDSPHKVRFSVQFPRARQDYHGILWAEGKNVISGIATMLNREFGFVAVREGSRLNLYEEPGTAVSLSPGADKPDGAWVRVRIEPDPERYLLGKEPRSGTELTTALIAVIRANPRTGVVFTVADSLSYSRLRQALELVRASGISAIRLASEADEP
jgi:biopolymer transport protein ExbD